MLRQKRLFLYCPASVIIKLQYLYCNIKFFNYFLQRFLGVTRLKNWEHCNKTFAQEISNKIFVNGLSLKIV